MEVFNSCLFGNNNECSPGLMALNIDKAMRCDMVGSGIEPGLLQL